MYRFDDFRVVLGASVRVVVHLGAWDESVCINAPGQSGDPRSLHYADLAPLWARGDYVPMLYSREAVDAAAERTIVLTPVSLSSLSGQVS
jgi:penicillin amidase